MNEAWPNGRDYYPQGPEALTRAQNVARDRVADIQDMIAEIEAEAMAISDMEGA